MRNTHPIFVIILLLAVHANAQSPMVDASVTLLSDSPIQAEPGEIGFLEFEVTNLGPDSGLVRVRAPFGLEGEIPITLYDEGFQQPPGTPVSCSVLQAISNPTPTLLYQLDPLPFLQPFSPGETRLCRIQYAVSSGVSNGTFSFDVAARDNDDPNLQNNLVTVEFDIGRQFSPFAIPTLGPVAVGLLILGVMLVFNRRVRRKENTR